MSKFTAIEARATQYPASTDDVVWLTARVRDLRDALLACRLGPLDNNCWCPVRAVGDTKHSYHCELARRAVQALEEPNLPVD